MPVGAQQPQRSAFPVSHRLPDRAGDRAVQYKFKPVSARPRTPVRFRQVVRRPQGKLLFRDNGYEPTTLQFVPAKERWSAGVLAQYAPNQILAFNARVERVWTREQDTPGLPNNEMLSVLAGSNVTAFTVPVISSNGWQFAVGATASF